MSAWKSSQLPSACALRSMGEEALIEFQTRSPARDTTRSSMCSSRISESCRSNLLSLMICLLICALSLMIFAQYGRSSLRSCWRVRCTMTATRTCEMPKARAYCRLLSPSRKRSAKTSACRGYNAPWLSHGLPVELRHLLAPAPQGPCPRTLLAAERSGLTAAIGSRRALH